MKVKNKEMISDNFWRDYIDYASDNDTNNMQNFMVTNELNSHIMVSCRKPWDIYFD